MNAMNPKKKWLQALTFGHCTLWKKRSFLFFLFQIFRGFFVFLRHLVLFCGNASLSHYWAALVWIFMTLFVFGVRVEQIFPLRQNHSVKTRSIGSRRFLCIESKFFTISRIFQWIFEVSRLCWPFPLFAFQLNWVKVHYGRLKCRNGSRTKKIFFGFSVKATT